MHKLLKVIISQKSFIIVQTLYIYEYAMLFLKETKQISTIISITIGTKF